MTVQQSLRILGDENLILSRQGSGVFVRERTGKPVDPAPHIEAASRRLRRRHPRISGRAATTQLGGGVGQALAGFDSNWSTIARLTTL